MKFIHIADVHLDMPFKILGKYGEKRRIEQLDAIRNLIEYIKKNNIDHLFISGDFYEHDYIRNTTIKSVIEIFKEIPKTKIYISPGNHDPYIAGSEYDKNNWPENVHIFKGFEIIEEEDVNIYGYGFTDFYDEGLDIESIELLENGKKNIMVLHGDLSSSEAEIGSASYYNPIYLRKIEQKNFDYVALGHIHKSNFDSHKNILYPGSLISYRFKDDDAGAIVGEFKKGYTYTFSNNHREEGFRTNDEEKLYLEHVYFDKNPFETEEIDISKMKSKEELVSYINNTKFDENAYIKLDIVGDRDFEFNTIYLNDNVIKKNIIKFEDNTKSAKDLYEIAKENNLKGNFIKKATERIDDIKSEDPYYIKNPEYINTMKAIEIVLDEMEQ